MAERGKIGLIYIPGASGPSPTSPLLRRVFGNEATAKQSVFFKYIARLMLSLPETMGRNATILDMIHLMEDPLPYSAAIESLPPIPRNFFQRDFMSKTFAQTKEQIRYRLQGIIENPTLARLFTSPRTKIDLFEEMNRGTIIFVDTAKDFLKDSHSHFGRIIISLVLQAALERAAIPEKDRKHTFLIVDEAASYFDNNIDDLLTDARKYKLGCVFAHQYLDQAASSLRASLAANTSIKFASGVSTNDARAMAADRASSDRAVTSMTDGWPGKRSAARKSGSRWLKGGPISRSLSFERAHPTASSYSPGIL
jgi:hypothetical protein